MNQPETLLKRVVDGGYCIGCGACAAVVDSPLSVELGEYGLYQAKLNSDSTDKNLNAPLLEVCPFSGEGPDEDSLGKDLFGEACTFDQHVGYWLANYAGYVSDGDFRDRGSSGGFTTWILCELLRNDLVDAIVHVKPRLPNSEDGRLFQFAVSTTPEEVIEGAKSRYYPVEMSEALKHVREHAGRYALVGVPCFVKAARLLARQDRVLADRIRYCIALFCGHLKSAAFADFLAWQCGVAPHELRKIDFRHKLADRKASDYGVQVEGAVGERSVSKTARVADLYGTSWGLGFFKYQACDYCDDVVGETADVSVGDAWLPEYVADSRGTNVVVVRNRSIHGLILRARSEGRLCFDQIEPDSVYLSQAAGFRHRRDGLSYRLHLADKAGRWRPPKRVAASAHRFDWRLRKIWRLRSVLAEQSHIAWKAAATYGDFNRFSQLMDPLVRQYYALYRPSLLTRVARRLLRYGDRIKQLLQSYKSSPKTKE